MFEPCSGQTDHLTAGIWAYILPAGELSSAFLIAQNVSFSSH